MGVGWLATRATWLTRIGSDPGDDEDLRHKKALLVLISILIAPLSVVWGILYLALGSAVGIAPLLLRRLARVRGGFRANPGLPVERIARGERVSTAFRATRYLSGSKTLIQVMPRACTRE
jgi:hypothetical protein